METINANDIKKRIRSKFKNVSRFSIISGMPYHFIQNAIKKNNEVYLARINRAVDEHKNEVIFDEVSPEQIAKAKDFLQYRDPQIWCRDNGINYWWLKQFLAGKVRFNNHHRVVRLFSLLGIKN